MKKIISLTLCVLILVSAAALCPVYAEYAPVFNEEDSCTYGIVPGDVNDDGSVNVKDVMRLLRMLAGHKDKVQRYESDVNRDGKLTIKDASAILKHIAGYTEVRLGHSDDIVTVTEATEDSFGLMTLTCSVCNSSESALIRKTGDSAPFSIKGVPLSEYVIVVGELPGVDMTHSDTSKIISSMRDALARISGVWLEIKNASTGNRYDHEIVFGVCDRDCVKDLDPVKPVAGIAEDGTLYFVGYTAAVIRYLFDEFMYEFFSSPYCDSFTASSGRTDILFNPWGKECNEWSFEVNDYIMTDEALVEAGYKLDLFDDFEGDSLNLDVWTYRKGDCNPNMVTVKDGLLTLSAAWCEETEWDVAGSVHLTKWYSGGYFEVKAKPSEFKEGNWSAFWIQGTCPYTPSESKGGIYSAEIDIFETLGGNNSVTHTIYCGGVTGVPDCEGGYSGFGSGHITVPNIEEEFHTYALLWDEDWYSFYIDGILVGRTSYGNGTSQVEQYILLSMCGWPNTTDTSVRSDFYVDYMKVYTK